MKRSNKKILFIVFCFALAFGCKKPFTPSVVQANNNYLVVAGVIAAGQDSTIINLSRTVNISGQNAANPELHATVTVKGDQNVSYPIPEIGSGKYAAAPLNLDNTHKYSLEITTSDGHTYASAYEPVKITPPIDTLYYNTNNDAVNLYVNAHDPTNNTRYYRWDYTETYIYKTPLEADYIYKPNEPNDTLKSVLRTPDQQVHICYVSLNSSNVVLNSTAALIQDVVNNNPITQVPSTSEKILYRYSILVRQYALTPDAYAFWTLLKKNTEQLGTIFDAQPVGNNGNITCTSNPAEPVVGYIGVSTISQKRIFIDRTELPVWPFSPPPACRGMGFCWLVGVAPVDPDITTGNYIPLGPIKLGVCGIPPRPGYDVTAAPYDCVDCTYHLGGKTKVPSFWK